MGGSWQCWCQGPLHPSQKTIMLDAGLWPRPQFLHTLASPGLVETRFLPLPLVATPGPAPAAAGCCSTAFAVAVAASWDGGGLASRSMTMGLAWIIFRPERVWVGSGVMISETSESSLSFSSESPSRLRLVPRALDAPARLPRGRPPRLTRPVAAAPRARPPRVVDPFVGGVAVMRDASAGLGVSTLILGFRPPPLPRAVPRLTPLMGRLGGVRFSGGGSIWGGAG